MSKKPNTDIPEPVRAYRRPINAVRLLRATDAAAYCGIGVTTFYRWIELKRMPEGKAIDGCVLWDIRALDLSIDELLYDDVPKFTKGIRRPKL